jgi:pyruvate kinase
MTKQMLKRARRTKIVATLGPASSDEKMIRALFEAGADVFRLNFSHGSHEDHAARHKIIRKIEAELCRPVGIMADLQGPKLRLGKFHNGGIDVVKGHRLHLDSDPTPGDPYRVQLPHPEILKAFKVGDPLLVDDGKVRLRIVEKNGDDKVTAEVECGSRLMDRKGVNMPGTIIDVSVLTEKDRKDMEFALSLGIEWIALSFVQRPEDIVEARELIGERAHILAKIEKPSAVDKIDQIVALADAIMLARGDLGVECPPEQVPVIQKQIIRTARAAGKPLIIATQMLESMTVSPTPTRAEASDVATAVFDGADAVMLSAETASGNYPIESVEIMDRIAQTVEGDKLYREIMDMAHPVDDVNSKSNAITAAAYDVARHVGAELIVNFSNSGATALRMVRERPKAALLCMTCNLHVARRLSLSYGANPLVVAKMDRFEEMIELAREAALHQGFVKKGDIIVVTAGEKGLPGKTNTLRVVEV